MSEDVREMLESIGLATKTYNSSIGYADVVAITQAATASTEAKWRGLVEKLVEALEWIKSIRGEDDFIVKESCEDALTEAAQMLGGKHEPR